MTLSVPSHYQKHLSAAAALSNPYAEHTLTLRCSPRSSQPAHYEPQFLSYSQKAAACTCPLKCNAWHSYSLQLLITLHGFYSLILHSYTRTNTHTHLYTAAIYLFGFFPSLTTAIELLSTVAFLSCIFVHHFAQFGKKRALPLNPAACTDH